jgi:hypothetical protein
LGNTEQPGTLAVPAAGARLATTVTSAVAADGTVELGRRARIEVTVSAQGGTPAGAVTLVRGTETVATATLSGGRAVLVVPAARLGVGSHALAVRYAGDGAHAGSEDPVPLTVAKASSTTRVVARARDAAGRTKVTVKVASAVEADGRVRVAVRTDGRVVSTRTVTLRDGRASLVLRRLARGTHRITATYVGSASVAPSKGRTALRVTRAGR